MSIQLFTQGLNTKILQLDAPVATRNDAFIEKTFKNWTRSEKPKSAYAKRVFEKYEVAESKNQARKLRESFDTIVVLGIGGSALGAKAVHSALKCSLPQDHKRMIILDNLDPLFVSQNLDSLDLSKTCFCVISKSGGTIETMSQMALVIERLQARKLEFKKHIIAITDPRAGSLREWSAKNGLETLSIPSDVGGRFSVFTPVGLLPLAFVGHDIDALIEGASDLFQGHSLPSQEVLSLAKRIVDLEESFYKAHLLMPYATVLKDIGEWFVQLWGESLGKLRHNHPAVGSIPMVAVGATDQHSLLQLLVEGPKQIVSGFIEVEKWPPDIDPKVPVLPAEFKSLSYSQGKTFSQILNAELLATTQVFEKLGRPFYKINLKELNAYSVGSLLGFYMDLVTYCGAIYEIDPYNQPGVELGKKILPNLLGK